MNPRVDVNIREARPGDAAAIEALYRELVSSDDIEVRSERIKQISLDPNNFLLVAECDEDEATEPKRVVATALVTFCLDPMFGFRPYAVVENVIVAEGMRGIGIGKRLFASMEQLASNNDCTLLLLLSSVSRPKAHTFFESVGFQSDSKRGFVKYLGSSSAGVQFP